jgi:hypothetical protein
VLAHLEYFAFSKRQRLAISFSFDSTYPFYIRPELFTKTRLLRIFRLVCRRFFTTLVAPAFHARKEADHLTMSSKEKRLAAKTQHREKKSARRTSFIS